MPCLGEYLEGNYACESSCYAHKTCIRKMLQSKRLMGLPEFLVHPNWEFRDLARTLIGEWEDGDHG